MRILVTRPQADAERTAARLAARGHEALVAPVLAIAPSGEPLPPGPFDALVLTSAHAAGPAAVLDRALPVYAVGARTGAAAQAAGFAQVRAAGGDARALAALLRAALPPPARLLHAAGRDRKPEPAASLTRAGYAVTVWTAYEARAAGSLTDALASALRGGRLDVALHYSRRSAAILAALGAAAGLTPDLERLRHLCLSEDVAAGLPGMDVAVAPEPREEALLDLLDAPADGSGSPPRFR